MSKSTFSDLINSETPALIDFYADWCGPCKAFAPTLKILKEDLGDQLRVIKINIDKNEALATRLGIRSVPTVLLYHNGDLKWKASGVQPLHEMKKQVAQLD